MPETFHLHARAIDVRPLEDCFLAIFNSETSDRRRYYELVRLAISDPAPISTNTAGVGRAGKLQLFRTTAQSGGDAITPVKHDTNSASLPAEVEAVNNPTSVTTTGIAIRGIADAPSYSITANNGMAVRTFGGYLTPYGGHAHNADIWRCGGSDVEPMVLREGEGIALTQAEAGVPHAMAIACQVTNASTGATYTVRARSLSTDPIIGNGIWGLFNGSGSGVVLQVRVIILPMDGETNLPMTTRLAKISGLDTDNGEALTPFAADTDNSVPASLQCYTGPMRARLVGGWDQDWQYGISATSIPLAQQQRAGVITQKTYSKDFPAIGSSVNLTMQRSGLDDIVMFHAPAGSGIRINPGEGIGLLSGRGGVLDFSTFHTYNIEATILHYPPDTGAYVQTARPQYHLGIV